MSYQTTKSIYRVNGVRRNQPPVEVCADSALDAAAAALNVWHGGESNHYLSTPRGPAGPVVLYKNVAGSSAPILEAIDITWLRFADAD